MLSKVLHSYKTGQIVGIIQQENAKKLSNGPLFRPFLKGNVNIAPLLPKDSERQEDQYWQN